MKTSVYLRPAKKLLEHFPDLKDPVPIETVLDVTATLSRRPVLHIQVGYAQSSRPHHVVDSDGDAPFAYTGPTLVEF